jgi:hypothetical protein
VPVTSRFTCRWAFELIEKDPRRSPCIRCSTCDGHPCLINAKSDAQTLCVDPALEYPNVTLATKTKCDSA